MNKTELSPFPPSGGISVKDCNLWYGDFQALKEISMEIPENQCQFGFVFVPDAHFEFLSPLFFGIIVV